MDDPENPPPAEPALTQEQRLEEQRRLEEEARQKAEQEKLKIAEETKKLQDAIRGGGLQSLDKTADCASMCYTKLILAEKELQRLFPLILDYKHIRYLDISSNSISDISLLSKFPQLVSLNASKNQIKSLSAFTKQAGIHLNEHGEEEFKPFLTKLQVLNLSTNKVQALEQLSLPDLRRLNLIENEITEVSESWSGHEKLEILELRKNKLKKTTGLKNMPCLVELYLAENAITDFRKLQNLPKLTKLSLRNNKIKKILSPFPHLPALYHLNIRENQVEKIAEFQKIEKHVRSITFLANPCNQELGENAKKETVWAYPHLERINKSVVTVEERLEFEKELKEKLAERERERLEKEAETQRQQAEGAANPDQE